MSTAHILLLGAIAGGTIFLGLPMGRLQNLAPQARAGLSALATGILIFLLWDVLKGAEEPIGSALEERHHNFGEGLAIGQAAAASKISLAVTLIIGFGLHNATEGFGICGPMAGEGTKPNWGFLALLGLIGGGPTFLGTALGQAWSSEAVSVIFFAVAAGSILYVVQELFAVNRKYGHTVLVTWLVLAGLVLGFATDFVIEAAGV